VYIYDEKIYIVELLNLQFSFIMHDVRAYVDANNASPFLKEKTGVQRNKYITYSSKLLHYYIKKVNEHCNMENVVPFYLIFSLQKYF